MSELKAIAFVSGGVWVARCPRPWCVHADHYGPGPSTGRIGGLTDTHFNCMRCGLVSPAVWPHADVRADIWRLLQMRPLFETRNWLPGEPPENLLLENVQHGLVDTDELPGGHLMAHGLLAGPVRELVDANPGSRLMIGGC